MIALTIPTWPVSRGRLARMLAQAQDDAGNYASIQPLATLQDWRQALADAKDSAQALAESAPLAEMAQALDDLTGSDRRALRKDKVDSIEGPDYLITYDPETDSIVASHYAGSLHHLAPSGKFYTPFACGNVAACWRCAGTGTISSARREHIYERIQDQRWRLAAWLERQRPSWRRLIVHTHWTAELFHRVPCPFCDELGSQEAALDECWHEALEAALDAAGAFTFTGEGDPTDLFIGMTD